MSFDFGVTLQQSCGPGFFQEPEATVYGKRDGYLSGLAVMSRDLPKGSPFKGTKGWKQGTVHDCEMLERNNMFKPDASQLL